MRGLVYQLKNIRKDKLCILSFLLPILVALAINLLSGNSFSLGDTAFGVVDGEPASETMTWLRGQGAVTVYSDQEALALAIRDPATSVIGVWPSGDGIRTMVAGDELTLYRELADHLPDMYAQRNTSVSVAVQPVPPADDGLKALLIVITMVTAMFMGCTFNAMSIIGEKEDGIAYINEVMPITRTNYLVQKTSLGLIGGILSTGATALVCMRPGAPQILPALLLIILSAFISALAGLFIGKMADGLMVGIVYLKIVMIVFIAPPILFYLLLPQTGILHTLSYLLPSTATFYGLMDLLTGGGADLGSNLLILTVHCVFWLAVYLGLEALTHKRKQRAA